MTSKLEEVRDNVQGEIDSWAEDENWEGTSDQEEAEDIVRYLEDALGRLEDAARAIDDAMGW